METCFRCERGGREVRLLDAIYENEIVKVCENCSITESIPVLRKPTTSQLMESERSQGVSQRLRRLAGLTKKKEEHKTVLDQIREPEESSEEESERKPFNLVENFHWEVQRARRNKGLSPRQLGWALGESETAIKMVEKAELPEEGEKLIRKLEQFFQIKLRERTEQELEEERRIEEERERFRIPRVETELIDVKKEEIEEAEPIESIIEEPEVEMLAGEPETKVVDIEELEEREKREKPSPSKVLSFRKEAMNGITISDLKEMKEERDREERLVTVEEERKRALQADSIVQDIKNEEKRKRELREKIASEMKGIAMAKTGKLEKEKKEEKEKQEREHIPTIAELMEKKKEKSMVGDEIELAEEEKKQAEEEKEEEKKGEGEKEEGEEKEKEGNL